MQTGCKAESGASDHFHFRPGLSQENREAARERLAVASMPRDKRQNMLKQSTLPSRPAEGRLHAEGRVRFERGSAPQIRVSPIPSQTFGNSSQTRPRAT